MRELRTASAETALAALPEAVRVRAERLARAAETRGLALYLVGGPVRDLMLGRALRDADLTVTNPGGAAVGEQTAALAHEAALAGDRVTLHARFGTVRIDLAGGESIDLATVRRESYAAPGALPDIEPGTLEEDLRRRDFTLNALALPLNPAAGRALVDPGGGVADLRAGELRVFHAASFRDDPTRALRAARLAARFELRLARESRAALRDALRSGAFGAVSGERFAAELEKLFDEPRAGGDSPRALALLEAWHVLGALEPGLGLPKSALPALRRLAAAADTGAEPSPRGWVIGLMVWFAALQPPLARRALERLAIRGAVATRIAAFARVREVTLRDLSRARGRGASDALLRALPPEELAALRAWAPAPLRARIDRHASVDRHVALPVGGDDLVALGLAGPEVGRAIARIRAAVLDREVTTRGEALLLAREVAAGARRAAASTRAKSKGHRRKP
ncbi:MAG: CCA tRNA nucleotidyltransferase [Deltaproteobacteria bacterium]|nr:CCA tRNA nucleotidyltransferase [Deltaproteobacteria bacterium]